MFGCPLLTGCSFDLFVICMGLLSCGHDCTFTFLLMPALLCPGLGLFCVMPFISGAVMGVVTCYSGFTFGLIHLSTTCTTGSITSLNFACDPVCIKYFPSFISPIL